MNSPDPKCTLPADVNAETRSRLSPIRRETLGEEQKKAYDGLADRDGLNLAGLRGPGGIWLRVPELGKRLGELNRLLRGQFGLDLLLVEVAILATAREMQSHFEWSMHEPAARSLGLPQATLEAIRLRGGLSGVPPEQAVLITLAREAVGARQVSAATYARVLELFGEERLIKFSTLIGSYAMTAVVLGVFDQQLPEGRPLPLP